MDRMNALLERIFGVAVWEHDGYGDSHPPSWLFRLSSFCRDLPDGFVRYNANGNGKVQRAQSHLSLGDFEPVITCPVMNFLRDPFAFVPEEQTVSSFEACVPYGFFRMCGKKINVFRPIFGPEEVFPVRVLDDIERLPVVHSRTPKVLIRNFKTQGVNQMEATIGKCANSANVPGVLRYFRAIENDLYHRFSEFFNA